MSFFFLEGAHLGSLETTSGTGVLRWKSRAVSVGGRLGLPCWQLPPFHQGGRQSSGSYTGVGLPSFLGGGGSVAQSCLTLVTPWTVVCQAPLSMGFSRQEYWSGLPFPSTGGLSHPGIETGSPALQAVSLPTELQGNPLFKNNLQK